MSFATLEFLQTEPFHWRARGCSSPLGCPASTPPTAHTRFVPGTEATPNSWAEGEASAGVRVTFHDVPSKCAAKRVVPFTANRPTAPTFVGEIATTEANCP